MSEKLCMSCREERRERCLIREVIERLQSQMPQRGSNEEELAKIQDLNQQEKEAHDLARKRGCLNHNDHTLKFPRIDFS